MAAKRTAGLIAVCLVACALPALSRAYGPEGHLIAGMEAERRLCPAARAQIETLTGGQRLPELGLWADRIRGDPAYAASSPWHYMNIADGASIGGFRHGPEGDVLEAIARFKRALANRSLAPAERAEALKFLVHFVVDIHQPLHVGRASDRGGNTIELTFRGERMDLHRFWDTGVIALEGLSVRGYLRGLRAELDARDAAAVVLDPVVWAEESLALRPAVYAFDPRAGTLDAAYVERAQAITRRRLAAAAVRLAATLNDVLCE